MNLGGRSPTRFRGCQSREGKSPGSRVGKERPEAKGLELITTGLRPQGQARVLPDGGPGTLGSFLCVWPVQYPKWALTPALGTRSLIPGPERLQPSFQVAAKE